VALSSLHRVIDLESMKEAYRLSRKDGAPGIDGVTAADCATNLEARSLGPPGSHQVRSLPSTSGPQEHISENGWLASAARHPDLRKQVGAEGDRHGAGGGV